MVVGVNLDWMNTSVYSQGQANGWLGAGYYVGWGVSIVGGDGDAPTTGFDHTSYAEADIGWGPAFGISASGNSCGNISGVSGAVPYKFGLGKGLGAFVDQSGTATAVSPTIQSAKNWFNSFKH